MLKALTLNNVGPAPRLNIEFGSRLNLLTGDNGLGKSFLLDVAWWALTRKWPHDLNPQLTSGYPARPTNPKEDASISFKLDAKGKPVEYTSKYDLQEQAWIGRPGRPWNPGLVIYAHADGGFSVWDPARNYWKRKGNMDVQDRLPGYVLSPKEVWYGLDVEFDGKIIRVCNGLLSDWSGWIREKGKTASLMEGIMRLLSPPNEILGVGPIVRLSIEETRDIPSLRTPYSDSVPVLHASAGIRRAIGLAYMFLWSWNEHVRACELLGQEPSGQVILLFDEVESHLHPRWQRTILSTLLRIAEIMHDHAQIQLIAATHSPLILASAEPMFDPARDAWWDLDLEANQVVLRQRPFVPHGEISNWLTSQAFDLTCARSLEAEDAVKFALDVLREATPSNEAIKTADENLRKARLPEIDPFWVRWSHFVEQNQAANQPSSNAGVRLS